MPLNLFLGRSTDSFADEVLLPWFVAANRSSWTAPGPVVVVVPNMAHAHRIRQILAKNGVPSLNVHFWSPVQLRAFIARSAGLLLPWEESGDRVAILRAAAESVVATDPENLSARALAADPGALNETLDLVEAGGWSCDVLGIPALTPVFAAREAYLASSGRTTPARFSFNADPSSVSERISKLLIAGFDAAHWSEWATLRLGVLAADEATVLLRTPRRKSEQIELTWLASWEAMGAEIGVITEDDPRGAVEVAAAFDEIPFEGAGETFPDCNVEFALADCAVDEAEAAAALVAKALQSDAARIGIIVPASGYLAGEVARCLDRLEFAYFNGVPARRSESPRADLWRKILGCLESPTVEAFFTVAGDPALAASRSFTREELRRFLDRECSQMAFPDLCIAADIIKESTSELGAPVATLMRKFSGWPARAPIGDYLALLGGLCDDLWPAAAGEIERLRRETGDLAKLVISLRGLRDWLEPRLTDTETVISDAGGNPYARVQVLRPADASGLAWDFVVMVGQNESEWPPQARPCPFLGDDALRLLNAQVVDLNRDARAANASIDDVDAVKNGHALCLSPALERNLRLREFADFLEGSAALAVTASVRDPNRPGSSRAPGELFARLFQLLHRKPVARGTPLELKPANCLPREALKAGPADQAGVRMMLQARDARLDPDGPFGPYEFCLSSKPTWPVRVSASSWGAVNERPATVFMQHFLGVRAPRDYRGDIPWALLTGIWLHDWISKAVGKNPVRVASLGPWKAAILAQADAHKSRVAAILGLYGRDLPAWWTCLYEQTVRLASQFSGSLDAVRNYQFVQAEAELPESIVKLPSGAELPVRGRVDLLFLDRLPIAPGDFTGVNLAVFDFKTGHDRPLTVERIKHGVGLQLPIYGLGYREHGAQSVAMALLKPGAASDAQLQLPDLVAAGEMWERLAWMLETGTFGRLEPMRPEFGGGRDFPIASLETPVDLASKWKASQAPLVSTEA
jgi:hypothetical protein